MKEAEHTLLFVLLSLWRAFRRIDDFRAGVRDPEMYSLSTVEALQNFYLGASTILKEYVVSYISFGTIVWEKPEKSATEAYGMH